MAYVVMAYIVVNYIVVTYIDMAYIVMAGLGVKRFGIDWGRGYKPTREHPGWMPVQVSSHASLFTRLCTFIYKCPTDAYAPAQTHAFAHCLCTCMYAPVHARAPDACAHTFSPTCPARMPIQSNSRE